MRIGKKWELKDSFFVELIYLMYIYEKFFMGKKFFEEIFIEKLIGGFFVGLKYDNYIVF